MKQVNLIPKTIEARVIVFEFTALDALFQKVVELLKLLESKCYTALSMAKPIISYEQLDKLDNLLVQLLIVVRDMKGEDKKKVPIPKDQEYFWTEEWQKKEREADEDFANGNYVEFANIEDALDYLHKQV